MPQSELIVFLDFDDVLNDRSRYREAFVIENYLVYDRVSRGKFIDSCLEAFTPQAKSVYKKLCEEYNPKIVVSSSWANSFAENHFTYMFRVMELPLNLHEDWMTRRQLDNANNRYTQILDWLQRHPEVTDYLILDDTESGESLVNSALAKNTVFAKVGVGLVEEDYNLIKKILER